ncbi:MAG TPA: hypothetical protein PKN75_12075 [Bacteroidia bacterium]|nr:hypothetical protein [Bacteroidia bacterium]HNU34314.1 hypothetical protein [Bacteroidia bacterium]
MTFTARAFIFSGDGFYFSKEHFFISEKTLIISVNGIRVSDRDFFISGDYRLISLCFYSILLPLTPKGEPASITFCLVPSTLKYGTRDSGIYIMVTLRWMAA